MPIATDLPSFSFRHVLRGCLCVIIAWTVILAMGLLLEIYYGLVSFAKDAPSTILSTTMFAVAAQIVGDRISLANLPSLLGMAMPTATVCNGAFISKCSAIPLSIASSSGFWTTIKGITTHLSGPLMLFIKFILRFAF